MFALNVFGSSYSDKLYINSEGNDYMVRDIAGDCAHLSLMCNSSFTAPVRSSNGLQIVSFASVVYQEDCFIAYSSRGDRAILQLEIYLERVLRTGFWIGTIFYI